MGYNVLLGWLLGMEKSGAGAGSKRRTSNQFTVPHTDTASHKSQAKFILSLQMKCELMLTHTHSHNIHAEGAHAHRGRPHAERFIA